MNGIIYLVGLVVVVLAVLSFFGLRYRPDNAPRYLRNCRRICNLACGARIESGQAAATSRKNRSIISVNCRPWPATSLAA